jgi:hypothetical protein
MDRIDRIKNRDGTAAVPSLFYPVHPVHPVKFFLSL